MPRSFPYTRTASAFDPKSEKPFKLSRSKIDLFLECPRCFYLDRRLGVKRPSLPGFTLNIAVDHLLKKEFDTYRVSGKPHPLMKSYGIDAIPFSHPELNTWRENFVGIQHHHVETNFLVFGALDDIWISPDKKLHVVDYKATSKKDKPTLEGRWGKQYKRQMEVYQWLLSKNDFTVSNIGYFVYANGRKNVDMFDGKLEFDMDVISYEGNNSWIEKTLGEVRKTLESDAIPKPGDLCEHCPYREEAGKELLAQHGKGIRTRSKKEVDLKGQKTTSSMF